MKHDSRQTRVRRGMAIIIGLFVLAALIFNLDVIRDWFRGYVDVVALVTETSGVRVGAPAFVEGIEAGHVTAIDFVDLGGSGVIALHVRLQDRVRTAVRKGSRAQTARQRFIGAPGVRITAGPPDTPPIESGDTLYPLATVSLDSLIERGLAFPETLDSLAIAVTELNHLVSARRPAVGRLLDRVEVVTAEASQLRADLDRGSVGRWLDDPELGDRIAALQTRLDSLGVAAERARERYQDPELRGGVASVAARAERLGAALDELQSNMAEGTGGFIPRAAQDTALAVAIRGVQAQIDSLTAAGLGFALRMILP